MNGSRVGLLAPMYFGITGMSFATDHDSEKKVDQNRSIRKCKGRRQRTPPRGPRMAIGQMNRVIQHVRELALARDVEERTDGQLLECFVSRKEQAALDILVLRHGPMVWGVCRRLL